ncbi:MAG: glycosyltransferase family 4 protein [Actinobacteria bacterium]|nr:glycosyltransferase family 4 protein [Actinomycetota bacterium]
MRALVVTSVHRADDPRIRERTLRSLAGAFEVRYATRAPGPSTGGDHEWVELPGGRLRRWWAALRQMCRRDLAVVSVHDPELVPAALLARLLRRVPVVVDVHEDVPAQVRHRAWVWRPLRPAAAWAAARALRLAERFATVTLAEPNYRHLFRRDHPVFPNYPAAGSLPPPAPDAGYLVYVGDITEERGAVDMVEAAGAMDEKRPLRLVGRCRADLAELLRRRAAACGVSLELLGPLPHFRAMEEAAGASAGFSLLHDLPNYRDSLPTKVIEYLALGVPVVASELAGTREALAGRAAVEVVPPGDPLAAARAVARLLAEDARTGAALQASVVRRSLVWPDAAVRRLYLQTARVMRS